MRFCVKCGQQLPERAQFCTVCGTPVENRESDSHTERTHKFAGNIVKCPACGEEIPSFIAICPACGHEINSAKVSPSVSAFISALNECDKRIAENPSGDKSKKGWGTWNKEKRIMWIILNIFTSCIPLIIYLVLPLIKPIFGHSTPSLSAEEKKKVALIENTVFPNEREAILESLIFIKSKVAYLATEKYTTQTAYWMRLWNTKAAQLQQKVAILLKDDAIASKTYDDILQNKIRVEKEVRIRAAIGTIIILIFVIFVWTSGALINGRLNDYQNNIELINWDNLILGKHIPYFGYDKAEVVWDTENVLILDFYNMDNFKFKSYIEECKNFGYTIDAENSDANYTAYNQDGYYLHLQYLDFTNDKKLTIDLENPTRNDHISWPNNELVKNLPMPKTFIGEVSTEDSRAYAVYLTGIEPSYFNEYVTLCMNNGFDVDYSKSNTYFSAENKDGISLTVEYKGFNTLYIYISNYGW